MRIDRTKRALVFLSWIGLASVGWCAAPSSGKQVKALDAYFQLPFSFEPNHGQAAAPIRFMARGSGYGVYLTQAEAVLSLRNRAAKNRSTIRLRFIAAAPSPAASGLDLLPGKSHYLRGSDPSGWHVGIPHYARVRYESVYQGIDVVYYGNQGNLEYDFVVQPGADPAVIRLRVDGVDGLALGPSGDLLLRLDNSELIQRRPAAYQLAGQQREPVESAYRIDDEGLILIEIGDYDRSRGLIIDPVLLYSTFLGGSGQDESYGMSEETNSSPLLSVNPCEEPEPVPRTNDPRYPAAAATVADSA